MNILLTGAAGYLGSALLQHYETERPDGNLILLTSREIPGYRCILHKNYTYSRQDFLDAGIRRIDAVIAAGAYVEHGKDPNLVKGHLSSVNHLDYLLEHLPNVPEKLVYISSVAVYGFDQVSPYVPWDRPMTESAPLLPKRVYALSKCMCERLAEEWCRNHGCELQILRLGPTCSAVRPFKNFLAYAMGCAMQGKPFTLTTAPGRMWNFINTLDAARFIFRAAELPEGAGPINLVSSTNYSSLEVLDQIRACCPDFAYQVDPAPVSYGQDSWFDASRREKYLGTETQSLEKTLNGMLKNRK